MSHICHAMNMDVVIIYRQKFNMLWKSFCWNRCQKFQVCLIHSTKSPVQKFYFSFDADTKGNSTHNTFNATHSASSRARWQTHERNSTDVITTSIGSFYNAERCSTLAAISLRCFVLLISQFHIFSYISRRSSTNRYIFSHEKREW